MSRSRTGCSNCKKRHRKCDERRPTCWACEAQGLECNGYKVVLRWDTGRRAAHRHITSIPERPAADASSEQPTDQLGIVSYQAPTYMSGTAASVPDSPWSQNPLCTTEQQREECSLVDEFFKDNVYQLYSTRRDDDIPDQLRELSQQSPAVHAIIASMHLYLTDPSDENLAYESYFSRGIALFQSQLDRYSGSVDVSALCAGTFICTINLYQAVPWTSLLEHMMIVYEIRRHLQQQTTQLHPMMHFFIEIMAVMDIPTFVRGRDTFTNGIWVQVRSAQRVHNGDTLPGGINTLSGLPRSLLDIFANIQDESAESRFLSWPGEVGEVPLSHLWEAYRCAGVLTSRRIRKTHHRDQVVSAEILMSRLIAALDALCETRRRPEYSAVLATNALLYPFVASRLEVSLLRRNVTWLNALKRMQQLCRPYGETKNARYVLEMLEEAYDTNDDDYDLDEQARRRQTEVTLF